MCRCQCLRHRFPPRIRLRRKVRTKRNHSGVCLRYHIDSSTRWRVRTLYSSTTRSRQDPLPSFEVSIMPVSLMSLGRSLVSCLENPDVFHRSPDGQALMLSSADGYCSIVVFDMAELGTVHPTQQHHRQLAAIAQSHSHSSSYAPPSVPHSPALSTMRQSPAPGMVRSEREGSASSSIAPPPLFVPSHHPPSSTASSTDPTLPTPGEESEAIGFSKTVSSESDSSTGLGINAGVQEAISKRSVPASGDEPRKKRRVALTHLGDGEGI